MLSCTWAAAGFAQRPPLERALTATEREYFGALLAGALEAVSASLQEHEGTVCALAPTQDEARSLQAPASMVHDGVLLPVGVAPRWWVDLLECHSRRQRFSVRLELSAVPRDAEPDARPPSANAAGDAGAKVSSRVTVVMARQAQADGGRAVAAPGELAFPAELELTVECTPGHDAEQIAAWVDRERLLTLMRQAHPPPAQGPSARPRPAPDAGLQHSGANEREVYAAALARHLRGGPAVAIDGRAVGSAPEGALERLAASGAGLDASVLADFREQNQGSQSIERGQLPATALLLEAAELNRLFVPHGDGWKRLRAAHPSVSSLCVLSRVGFSADRAQALVSVGCRQSARSGEGAIYVLFLGSDGWQVAYKLPGWVS